MDMGTTTEFKHFLFMRIPAQAWLQTQQLPQDRVRKPKLPLTKGSRCNWSPVWKGWLIHDCLLSAVLGVKGMTREDVPRRPAVWIQAKNLHLLVLLMGERADITCYAKCTAQRELVWKQFILLWGKKQHNSNYYLWSINKYFWKVSIFSRLWLQSLKICCLIFHPPQPKPTNFT